MTASRYGRLANIVNKQSRTADLKKDSDLGVVSEGPKLLTVRITMLPNVISIGLEGFLERPKKLKMDMTFEIVVSAVSIKRRKRISRIGVISSKSARVLM
jgi:hypothetical protein